MEGERNVVLGVGERKRSRNGAGRIGNGMVSGGREIFGKIKKPSNFGEVAGNKNSFHHQREMMEIILTLLNLYYL